MSRGRRKGAPDTRAEILDAAQRLFAERGVAGTSIRAIATEAGVDPALVHHYYGTKNDLLLAALRVPVDPRAILGPVVAAGLDGAGERLLRAVLGQWDDPENRPALVAMARTVIDPSGSTLLGQGFLPVVLVPAGEALGVDRPEVRMPLVASQVMGVLLGRYLLDIEPIASMSVDAAVEVYAPVLQRFLTMELPE